MFLRFETDLNFSRPRFSEIKVQIKRPSIFNAQNLNFDAKTETVSLEPIQKPPKIPNLKE